MRKQFSCVIIISIVMLCVASAVYAEEITSASDALFTMSLSELMDVEVYVPATLTEKDPHKTPASVTIITAEDIARTPARNLLDLIEIYVPGALYMNHSVGPVPGIRGIIADRPYKFLVNVNGINVNIKAHYGARLELLNWDINDIQRVEIARGPGAVTYGPGAIGGVINIYTKKGKDAPGFQTGTKYWDKYNSIGQYASYNSKVDQTDVYGYFSVVSTQGITPDLFGVQNATNYGWIGQTGGPYYPSHPASYMADYYHQPQVKAHIDVQLPDNWRFWGRYVSSSSSLVQGSAIKYDIDGDGDYDDFRQTLFRYMQFALEHQEELNDEFSLKSKYAFSSIDVRNVEKYYSSLGTANDNDNLRNMGWMWSENEYYMQQMLNYQPDDDRTKIALGFECSIDTFGPSWGKNSDDGFRMGSGIISGHSSDAYGSGDGQVDESDVGKYFAAGDGWHTFQYAFLGELNYQVTPKLTTILSGRVDKHSYTDYMFSPRFAMIYETKPEEYLKFIAQRSVRMNTAEELYMNEQSGTENKPEKLEMYELIYSGKIKKSWDYQLSTFYYQNDAIAWNSTLRRSAPLGTLEVFGLEVETKYQTENFCFGANHSYIKQLKWNLSEDIQLSGISYSNYYKAISGAGAVTSTGNDLNNWSNHATKFFSNIDLCDKKLTLHGDAQIFWGFDGNLDGLNALSEAVGGSNSIDAVRDKDAYRTEIRANASLTYHVNPSSDVTFFVQNIPVLGDNKRYSYSSGYQKAYPDKSSWVEEPMVFGLQARFRF